MGAYHLEMEIRMIMKEVVTLEKLVATLQGDDLLHLPLLVLQCKITRYCFGKLLFVLVSHFELNLILLWLTFKWEMIWLSMFKIFKKYF